MPGNGGHAALLRDEDQVDRVALRCGEDRHEQSVRLAGEMLDVFLSSRNDHRQMYEMFTTLPHIPRIHKFSVHTIFD